MLDLRVLAKHSRLRQIEEMEARFRDAYIP